METREYTYKYGFEQEDIRLDVHWRKGSPRGSDGGGHPVVIIFHGGGFVQGSKAIVPLIQIEELVRLGFVVVVPNYRLCPQVSVYDGPVTDARDCLLWVQNSLAGVLASEVDSVFIDTNRMATMGHSSGAALAGLLAASSSSVVANLDFYGGKYYTDPCWHSPSQSPIFVSAPHYPESLTERIYCGPQLSAATPVFGTSDLPPRDAWLSNGFKAGNHMALVVKDGNFNRIDPAAAFSKGFPPTMFIHGTEDTVTPIRISERAYEQLTAVGVKTEIIRVEGADHMFDMFYSSPDDGGFQKFVLPGLAFLACEVGL